MHSNQQLKCHGLSIDVEDWFHILECKQSPPISYWPRLDIRVSENIALILDLLSYYNQYATFFVLGWVAERYPDLVRQICDRGHEIGSHGHLHNTISPVAPDEFARDLDRSLTAISKAANKDILAYRAPGFSITYQNLWAFEILASRGIKFDSSIFIGPHAHGGLYLERTAPFEIILPSGNKLIEFPIVPFILFKQKIPFSGGGYLRLLPVMLVKHLFKLSEQNNSTLIVYVHPRDFDPEQPRMNLSPIRYFKYYIGLNNFLQKFEELITSFEFDSFGRLLRRTKLEDSWIIKKIS